MSSASRVMEIIINARDMASNVLRQVQQTAMTTASNIEGLTGKLNAVGQAGLVVGGTLSVMSAPAVAGLSLAVRTGVDFEQQMANVQSVAGATTEELAMMESEARKMASTTRYTASDAAGALYDLASQGMNSEQSIGALSGVMLLAAATNSDLSLSAQLTSSTLSQFSLQAEESGRVADVFAMAISKSPATMTKLDYSLKQVGPVASAFGYTIEETTASLMMLYKAGFKGEQAGTTLRGMMVKLIEPSSEAKKIMDKYSLSVLDASGNLKDMNLIIDEFKRAQAQGMTNEEMSKIFGLETIAGALAMLGQGSEAYEKYLDMVENSEGKAAEMQAIQMDTVKGQMDVLKAQMEEAQLQVFDAIAPAFKELITMIIENMPVFTTFAISVAKGFIAVAKAVTAVAGTFAWLFSLVPAPLQDIIGQVIGLGLAFAAVVGPVLLAVGGIAMSLSSILAVIAELGITTAGVSAVIGSVLTGIAVVAGTVATGIATLASAITLPILAIIAAIALLYLAWTNNWLGIQDTVKSAALFVGNKLIDLEMLIRQVISEIGGFGGIMELSLKGAFLNPITMIQAVWDKNLLEIRDIFGDRLDEILNLAMGLKDRFYKAGQGLIQSFIDGLESKFQAMKTTVLELLQWIRNHLPSSPAKEGPLSDIQKVGTGMLGTIGKSITEASPLVKTAISGVTGEMRESLETNYSYGGSSSVTHNSGGDRYYNIIIEGTNLTMEEILTKFFREIELRG